MRNNPLQSNELTDRFLRINEVTKVTGLAKNTIYNLARQGKFARPMKLSHEGRASGFLLSEINQWMQGRIAERDANCKGINHE